MTLRGRGNCLGWSENSNLGLSPPEYAGPRCPRRSLSPSRPPTNIHFHPPPPPLPPIHLNPTTYLLLVAGRHSARGSGHRQAHLTPVAPPANGLALAAPASTPQFIPQTDSKHPPGPRESDTQYIAASLRSSHSRATYKRHLATCTHTSGPFD